MSRDLRSPDTTRSAPDGAGHSVAIVSSRFNEAVVERLVRGARDTLLAHGVATIDTYVVPGALEIPQFARALVATGRYDALVALGAVIKGDTYHFEVVCDASAAGLMQLSMATDVVVTNGILTVYDEEQAAVRSGPDDRNKGTEAALAALETLEALGRLRQGSAQ